MSPGGVTYRPECNPLFAAQDLSGLDVSVIGAGLSGMSAARLLDRAGARVFVSEGGTLTEDTRESLQGTGIAFEESGHSARSWQADLVVTSPGVPSHAEPLARAADRGIPVVSEVELASWFCAAPIVAVTGSNGKTSTTLLMGHIAEQAGRRVAVCGNVGSPFCDHVDTLNPDDLVVLEVSSFQLDHVHGFHPHVAILLNITPDHLNRYGGSMDRYAASKARIAARLGRNDHFVYVMDDERAMACAATIAERPDGPQLHGITHQTRDSDSFPIAPTGATIPPASGWVENDLLMWQLDDLIDKEEPLMHSDELALRGRHNVYNSLAAAVAARVVEVRSDVVRESLRTFEGVPHRLEAVREIDGVRYVNDSKATNVNAVWYALESFSEPVILIAGGRDKGNDYSMLAPLVKERVRALISIGEAAETIHRDLGPLVSDSLMTDTMDDAVKLAHLLAREGDVVLLSPACASFDMFSSFEERGDHFRQLVSNL